MTDTVITLEGSTAPSAVPSGLDVIRQIHDKQQPFKAFSNNKSEKQTNNRADAYTTSIVYYDDDHLDGKMRSPAATTLHKNRAVGRLHPSSFATFHGASTTSSNRSDRPRLQSLFSSSDICHLSAYGKRPGNTTTAIIPESSAHIASRSSRVSRKFSNIMLEPVTFLTDTGNDNSSSSIAKRSPSEVRSINSIDSVKSYQQSSKKFYQHHRKRKSNHHHTTPTEVFAKNLSEAVLNADDSCDDGYVYNTKMTSSNLCPPLISPTLFFDLSSDRNGTNDTKQGRKHQRRPSSQYPSYNNNNHHSNKGTEDSYFPDYFQYQQDQEQAAGRPGPHSTVSELPLQGSMKSFYLSAMFQSKFEEKRRRFFQQQQSKKPPSPSFFLSEPPSGGVEEDGHSERRRVSDNDEEEALLENTPLLHYSATSSSLLARRIRLHRSNLKRKRAKYSSASKLKLLFRCCYCRRSTRSSSTPVISSSMSTITVKKPRFSTIKACFNLTLSIGSVVGVICVTSLLYLV